MKKDNLMVFLLILLIQAFIPAGLFLLTRLFPFAVTKQRGSTSSGSLRINSNFGHPGEVTIVPGLIIIFYFPFHSLSKREVKYSTKWGASTQTAQS